MLNEKIFGVIGGFLLLIYFILFSIYGLIFEIELGDVFVLYSWLSIIIGFSLIGISVYFISKKLKDEMLIVSYFIFSFFFIFSFIVLKLLPFLFGVAINITFSIIAMVGLFYCFNGISIYIESHWFFSTASVFIIGLMMWIFGTVFYFIFESGVSFSDIANFFYLLASAFIVISFIRITNDIEKFSDKKIPLSLSYIRYKEKKKLKNNLREKEYGKLWKMW